jgi:hypothetical protein
MGSVFEVAYIVPDRIRRKARKFGSCIVHESASHAKCSVLSSVRYSVLFFDLRNITRGKVNSTTEGGWDSEQLTLIEKLIVTYLTKKFHMRYGT